MAVRNGKPIMALIPKQVHVATAIERKACVRFNETFYAIRSASLTAMRSSGPLNGFVKYRE